EASARKSALRPGLPFRWETRIANRLPGLPLRRLHLPSKLRLPGLPRSRNPEPAVNISNGCAPATLVHRRPVFAAKERSFTFGSGLDVWVITLRVLSCGQAR